LYSDRKVPDAKGNAQNGNSAGDSTFGKLGGLAAKLLIKITTLFNVGC